MSLVSIAPLLRALTRKDSFQESELIAARELPLDSLSNSQHVLFLALLRITGHALTQNESQRLDHVLSDELCKGLHKTSIANLLTRLIRNESIPVDDIAGAIALIFDDRLDSAQCAVLLGLLAFLGLDRDPEVLARTAKAMRCAAIQINQDELRHTIGSRDLAKGRYSGGLCDIVGTGGDGHSTFNVSTTASIIASCHLLLSKHGNRASSSTSGSADLLQAIQPRGPLLETITASSLPTLYKDSNYAFLFAPIFHSGMRHVASLRKELGIRTIFNVLGPLANPADSMIEARIVGVAEQSMGPIFAEALRLNGAKKALIVCGHENLDEISCAGKTSCWRLYERDGQIAIDAFDLEPRDFGLAPHPLAEVAGGKLPQENAQILIELLENKLEDGHPILDYVLLNAGALFAISGVCEALVDSTDHGPVFRDKGPGGQLWKEGVRLARTAIGSGEALKMLRRYVDATHSLNTS